MGGVKAPGALLGCRDKGRRWVVRASEGVMGGAIPGVRREHSHEQTAVLGGTGPGGTPEPLSPLVLSVPPTGRILLEAGATGTVVPWGQSRTEKGGVERRMPRRWARDPRKAHGMGALTSWNQLCSRQACPAGSSVLTDRPLHAHHSAASEPLTATHPRSGSRLPRQRRSEKPLTYRTGVFLRPLTMGRANQVPGGPSPKLRACGPSGANVTQHLACKVTTANQPGTRDQTLPGDQHPKN